MFIRRALASSRIPVTNLTTTIATPWRWTLIEACVDRGVPLFGICRGFQEMNVAFGGSLHPEICDLPGRMNHRMPRLENGEVHPDPEVLFADRHKVHLAPGGVFSRLLGCETVGVNSLHGQGILVARQTGRRRGRGGRRHDRGDPDRRRNRLRAGRSVARRIRPAAQPGQSRAVPGLRRGTPGLPPSLVATVSRPPGRDVRTCGAALAPTCARRCSALMPWPDQGQDPLPAQKICL